MLGKLLKHEMRATSRTMLPILGGMLLVSAIANFGFRGMDDPALPWALQLICVLAVVLFSLGLVAVGFLTSFVMIRRFRSSLLRDEGYIMHTLPVSIHAHVWSKAIVSAFWNLVTLVTVALSAFIMAADVDLIHNIIVGGRELLSSVTDFKNVEVFFELLALLTLGSVTASFMFYASLAVGHSFTSRKMLMSILAFLIIAVVTEFIGALAAHVVGGPGLHLTAPDLSFMAVWRVICLRAAAEMSVFTAAYYAVTVWSMRRKLNLE